MEINVKLLLFVVVVSTAKTANANFTFTYHMAQQCTEYICQHGYSYETYFRVDSEDRKHVKKDSNTVFEMHIAILASSNGHILLSPVPQPDASDPVYEIVIGGGANKFTELRRNLRRNAKVSMKSIGILSPIEFRAFYIRIDVDGTINFGRENDSLPLLSYFDVNPLAIKYFSFAAWNGVEAKFLYDCPIPGDEAEFFPGSLPVLPKFSNSDFLKRTLLMDRDPYTPPSESVTVGMSVAITSIKYDAFETTLKTGISVMLIKPWVGNASLILPSLINDVHGPGYYLPSGGSSAHLPAFISCKQKNKWTDENMAWNPNKFNGITTLKFREGQVWVPTFFVYNSDTVSPLETKWPEAITMVNSGEATYHFHTQIETIYYANTKTYSKWPRDEYNCLILIEPWEEHEEIIINLLSPDDIDLNLFRSIDQEIQNEWEIKSRQLILTPNDVDGLFNASTVGKKHQLLIDLKLRRQATVYNIVFYTPLFVIMTFVLMSFWSEPLQLSRIWFYVGATITICLGMCYMDNLIPTHTVPSLLILYNTILAGVLGALLLHVALMTEAAERLCKTQYVQAVLMNKIFRAVFFLPALKTCKIYDSFHEAFPQDEEQDTVSPRSNSVEEMDRDNCTTEERVVVAECLDKSLFLIYSVVFAVLLALHY